MGKKGVGKKVKATKDIGGVLRERVPKGTKGVVTKSSLFEYRVRFTIDGWLGDKVVEIDVESDEVD